MKKFLSLVLALVMTMSLVTISAGAAEVEDFTDLDNIDYVEAVEVLRAAGILDGYTDGSFRPDTALNRGQAAKIICNMILGPTAAAALPTSVAPYSDVPAGSTFAGYIAYLSKEGLVSGYADGTFKPGNPLTGYAFMKMLLGVVGYDAEIEGYNTTNWAVSVAKQALALKLYKGLEGEFSGNKTVTRQEAMLYALNALECDVVTYKEKGTNIVIGGVTIQTGASEATTDLNGDNTLGDQKLYAKLFDEDLEPDYAAVDKFGRPATSWTWKNEAVGTYADKADYVITADTKIYTINKGLGVKSGADVQYYYSFNMDDAQIKSASKVADETVFVKYYDSTSTKKLSAMTDLTYYVGNGVTVEFFYDKDDQGYNKIVVIDEYFDEIAVVDEDDDGKYVQLLGTTTSDKFYTDVEFAVEQKVLVTTNGTDIVSVKAAEKQTGKLTKAVGGVYTIDGVEYKFHAGKAPASVPTVGKSYDFYLDSCGYIISWADASVAADVSNLVLFTSVGGDSVWGYKAKAIYGTGKTDTVDLKSYANENTFYTFSLDANKVKTASSVSYTSKYQTGDFYFVQGGSKIVSADETETYAYLNNKTVFVYIDGDGDTTVYNGYKNAPNFDGAAAIATYTKKTPANAAATLVYVWTAAATMTNDDATATYLVVDTYDLTTVEGETTNESYYTVRTLGGEKVNVDATAWATIASAYATNGVLVASKLTYDEGVVVGYNAKATNIAYGAVSSVVKVDEGVLMIDAARYDYDEEKGVNVYVIDNVDNVETNGGLKLVNKKAGTYAGYTVVLNDNKDVTTLVLLKA